MSSKFGRGGGGLDILYPNDRKEPVNLYGPNFKIKKDEHQKRNYLRVEILRIAKLTIKGNQIDLISGFLLDLATYVKYFYLCD